MSNEDEKEETLVEVQYPVLKGLRVAGGIVGIGLLTMAVFFGFITFISFMPQGAGSREFALPPMGLLKLFCGLLLTGGILCGFSGVRFE